MPGAYVDELNFLARVAGLAVLAAEVAGLGWVAWRVLR